MKALITTLIAGVLTLGTVGTVTAEVEGNKGAQSVLVDQATYDRFAQTFWEYDQMSHMEAIDRKLNTPIPGNASTANIPMTQLEERHIEELNKLLKLNREFEDQIAKHPDDVRMNGLHSRLDQKISFLATHIAHFYDVASAEYPDQEAEYAQFVYEVVLAAAKALDSGQNADMAVLYNRLKANKNLRQANTASERSRITDDLRLNAGSFRSFDQMIDMAKTHYDGKARIINKDLI